MRCKALQVIKLRRLWFCLNIEKNILKKDYLLRKLFLEGPVLLESTFHCTPTISLTLKERTYEFLTPDFYS